MGTQKNRLDETVLLSIRNICSKSWVSKYFQIYAEAFCLSKHLPCAPPPPHVGFSFCPFYDGDSVVDISLVVILPSDGWDFVFGLGIME